MAAGTALSAPLVSRSSSPSIYFLLYDITQRSAVGQVTRVKRGSKVMHILLFIPIIIAIADASLTISALVNIVTFYSGYFFTIFVGILILDLYWFHNLSFYSKDHIL